ncbi:MAG: hypothetical protein JXE07_05680 [Candidatus Aminicenantes bacterium]|nr:hypothetical protein [Candidatus Aminicenantes bacterium]
MKRLLAWLTLALLLTGMALADEAMIKLRAGYFHPRDKDFRDIYGGGMTFGLEVSAEAAKNVELWVEAGYFSKKGELSYTRETARLRIVPAGGGVRYVWTAGRLNYYCGLGLNYYSYREASPLGTVHWGRPGLAAGIGGRLRAAENASIDLSVGYSHCRMKPADFAFNVGGWELVIGLAYRLR